MPCIDELSSFSVFLRESRQKKRVAATGAYRDREIHPAPLSMLTLDVKASSLSSKGSRVNMQRTASLEIKG